MVECHRHLFAGKKLSRIGMLIDRSNNRTVDDSLAGIDVGIDSWDSDMMCYPNTFECEKTIYLLYNGNEFGRYGFGLAKLIDT